ncbi:G-type lectin S-receptor-like serine/threonine-protein kinase At4g03230 [Linum perenne]
MESQIATLFFFFLIIAVLLLSVSDAVSLGDIITFNATSDTVLLSDSSGETLVSAGGDFELGFFSPNESNWRYLGIWYRNRSSTVVWVGNRDNGLQDKTGDLCFTADGSFQIMNGTLSRSQSQSSGSGDYSLRLSDSGNLILTGNESSILWQSFDHPTDTFLSGMKMVPGLSLTSWTGPSNPYPGNYSFRQDQSQEFVVMNNSDTLWYSAGEIPPLIYEVLVNSSPPISKGSNYSKSRFRMGFDGRIQFYQSVDSTTSSWSEPTNAASLSPSLEETRRSYLHFIILGCIGGVLLISRFAFLMIYMRKARRVRKGRRDEKNMALRIYDSEKRVKEFINSEHFREKDKRDINVPFFDLDCILAATSFFSVDNKLGQGGFGPVYKGKFPGGQEIAVKRLSSASAQGLEEFKNEVILIAKLQHKNLVRLLGYCVERNEKILLYEYMPNKSLDFFIGYMSPEYALDGNFSIKSDVFSFGVVLLEIISGQRNTRFYKSDNVVSLLGHVWECWKEEKAMEVMDQSLSETCVANEFMRCVNVALLCVQEDPNDRPTMANIMSMLGSETTSLSRPKEPAFGKFPGGQEIAVKRLSSASAQGLEEFKNEVILIAKLQHKNLVRLLGYCVEGNEKILLYEYMPNKSLDFFIGYMSPEYALDGNFSIKSDVFSFGVVLLEILSGQRNTGFYKSNKVVSLLGHVWGCWKEEKAMEVMDQSLTETCVANEFMRCVNVALLCVQEDPNDRPTMANVVFMLGSEAASLSRPKEPAFSNRRQNSSTTGSSSIVSMETTTVLEAR